MKKEEIDLILKWFWKKCRAKLLQPQNQRKTSWRELSTQKLMVRLSEETNELRIALKVLKSCGKDEPRMKLLFRNDAIQEATDVANLAMMIADKIRQEAPQ